MLKYWLWLSTRRNLSKQSALAVLRHFSSPEAIYFSDEQAYTQVEGLKNFKSLLDKDLSESEKILNTCYRKGIHILTYQDAAYPNCLKNIDDPPILLYYLGTLPDFDSSTAIAVVGTRKATAYGLMQARHLAYQMSHAGVIIVSGGADGVDTLALRGCLSGGAPAVAVFGCGVDVIYPAANRPLFRDVREHGCIISEYPPGTPALAEHFPVRNRLLSGLSRGVLVVEAPKKSGALITARRALDQGRDVFAVPGNVGEAAEGNLQLLKEGAILTTDAWDVLKEYVHLDPGLGRARPGDMTSPESLSVSTILPVTVQNPAVKHDSFQSSGLSRAIEGIPEPSKQKPVHDKKDIDSRNDGGYIDVKEILDGLLPDEKTLVLLLQEKPLHIDDIIDQSQLPAGRVLAAVTLLEVKGYLKRLPARRFSLAEK